MKFECHFIAHEIKARQYILEHGLTKPEKLALMAREKVESIINEHCTCFKVDNDWLLVDREHEQEFNKITTWIER